MRIKPKFEYEYEGRTYEIYQRDDGNFYVNHIRLCSDVDKILSGLNSEDEEEVEDTKKLVVQLYQKGDQEIINWSIRRHNKYKRKAMFEEFIENWYVWLIGALAVAVIGGIIYLIFTLWWIFIGDSIFNGPFEYSTGEAIGFTILFFIVLICVLSDVVLRIIRGHF